MFKTILEGQYYCSFLGPRTGRTDASARPVMGLTYWDGRVINVSLCRHIRTDVWFVVC